MLRGILLLVMAPLAAHPAAAQTPRLTYWLIDLARVPAPVLTKAVAEAQRQFQMIGIEVLVVDPSTAASRPTPGGCAPLTVTILAEDSFRRAGPDNRVLGYTAADGAGGPAGAMISYDRIHVMAGRFPLSAGTLLGHVLAHELSHLLLRRHGHGSLLMKPHWSTADLTLADRGNLIFDKAHGARLARRVRDISLEQHGCPGGQIDPAPVP
ncbi:MAG TPA: hypothetical protein VLD67_09580 [Vicinamibacterales bacterium]|nr:hypothetical protein [Vicinamibacterales bacterium]